MPSSISASGVSVIVPTYREGQNLEPLIRRTLAALIGAGLQAEMIIVDDDSQDGTGQIVSSLAGEFPVRLIVRRGRRGLSTAVLEGLEAARHDRFVVMDADLQHPPESVPGLVHRLDRGDCDFVFASRYVPGSGIAGDWPWARRINSRVATWLAAPLARLSDPMSGFFALDRRTFERADRLDPVGYKIGLELYVKCGCRRAAEIPIHFGVRAAGESKTTVAERVRYLAHLRRLYRYKFGWAWRAATVVLAVAITMAGWLVVRWLAER